MPQPDTRLFRAEALEHRLRGEEGRGLIRVSPPWTWALLLPLLAALGTALALSILGRVEVNGRARGILRPRAGVRLLTSQVDGTLGRIEVRSSQQVAAGTVLARIEAPPIRAQLLEARRMTESIRGDFRAAAARQDLAHTEQEARLRSRMARLQDAAASHRQSVARLEQALQRQWALEREGIISAARLDEAREELAQAHRQLNSTEQGMDQASQESAALANQRQDQLWQRHQTIRGAETRRTEPGGHAQADRPGSARSGHGGSHAGQGRRSGAQRPAPVQADPPDRGAARGHLPAGKGPGLRAQGRRGAFGVGPAALRRIRHPAGPGSSGSATTWPHRSNCRKRSATRQRRRSRPSGWNWPSSTTRLRAGPGCRCARACCSTRGSPSGASG